MTMNGYKEALRLRKICQHMGCLWPTFFPHTRKFGPEKTCILNVLKKKQCYVAKNLYKIYIKVT